MYSPSRGQFISRDPLGFINGVWQFYLYGYVWDDPTNWVDPYGLQGDEGGGGGQEPLSGGTEHTSNIRPSTEEKHELSVATKERNQLKKEKADRERYDMKKGETKYKTQPGTEPPLPKGPGTPHIDKFTKKAETKIATKITEEEITFFAWVCKKGKLTFEKIKWVTKKTPLKLIPGAIAVGGALVAGDTEAAAIEAVRAADPGVEDVATGVGMLVVAVIQSPISPYSRSYQMRHGLHRDPVPVIRTSTEKRPRPRPSPTPSQGGGCFVKDTQVLTSNGTMAIQDLKVGDEVLSFDEKTKKVESRRVTHLHRTKRLDLVEVRVGEEVLLCSQNHRFYTSQETWVPASHLQPNNLLVQLLRPNEHLSYVGFHRTRKLQPQAVDVYNIAVEGNNNYFVGKSGILCHNWCFANSG